MELITSSHNPGIRELQLLCEKSRERRSRKVAVVEGRREITNALSAGLIPQKIWFCPEIISESEIEEIISIHTPKVYAVSAPLYSTIAYRGGTEGIIGIFETPERNLDDFIPVAGSFVILLESVEKPGNLGAILRTADASGAAAVIVCDPLTDLYNPNLIRASMGGIFTVPVFATSNEEAYNWLQKHSFQILTAQLQDSLPYYGINMTKSTAIVFGTEADGLTEFWRSRSDAKILIPMLGRLDSLNVSVSVAILCYEAVRQKKTSDLK